MISGIMSKQRLIDSVIQIYSIERQAVSSLYTQAGFLLTGSIAISAALAAVATSERLSYSDVSLSRDILLVFSMATLISVIISVVYVAVGVLPRTKYPKNRINDVVARLKSGEGTDERVEKALDALERLYSEASEMYQTQNELRAIKLKQAFKFLIAASGFLAVSWITVLSTQMYGG